MMLGPIQSAAKLAKKVLLKKRMQLEEMRLRLAMQKYLVGLYRRVMREMKENAKPPFA